MVNSLVDRATSDMLKGPDFAKIREICNICIRDAVQAKVAIKGVKKRLQSRSPKVQLLSLILLDTLVKNCGDVVHRNVIEKDLLIDMIKIMNKKPDYRVKEKILILIDTWQETLGGATAKRPQFYAAYLELLHAGVTFPRRSEKSSTKLTPPPQPQESPVTSLQIVSNEDQPKVTAISPKEDASPSLSSTEIQNSQGIMGVLEEVLNALEPKSKEVLCKDVIVDLVKNCPAYKQRVAQFVNSATDELLLQQGLALNDNLQLVSTKHGTVASETPILVSPVETPKPKSNSTVVKADAPLIDTEDSKHSDRSASNANQSPVVSNGQLSTPIKNDPKMDLLSFDDFSTVKNSLAIVPAGTPPNSQNGLGGLDMFSQMHDYPNGHVPNGMISQYEPSLYNPYFNGQITRSASHVYGNHMMTNNWFPQSWEYAKSMDNEQPLGSQYYNPTTQVTQVVITNSNSFSNQPGSQHVVVTQHSNPPTGLYSPQMQMGNFGYGSGYQNRMSRLSFGDDNNSVCSSTPSIKSSMTDDVSFGDLTDLSKLKLGKAVI